MSSTRVYKLLETRWAIRVLEERRLKISTFPDMNDPFELAGLILDPTVNPAKNFFAAKIGALCFSSSWENPMLWSHYADKHKGVCLGFDFGGPELSPLDYVDVPRSIDETASSILAAPQKMRELTRRILLTKYRSWGYEVEQRALVALNDADDGLYFYPFDDSLQLREVILGARLAGDSDRLVALAAAVGDEPPRIVRAMLSETEFKVIPAPPATAAQLAALLADSGPTL